MTLGKIFPIIILLLTSSLSGCMFFPASTFTLLSTNISDDQGFPSITIHFNVTDLTTLTFSDPTGNEVYTDEYSKGVHETSITLGMYRTTPQSGTYRLKAFDKYRHTIYEKELRLSNQALSLSTVTGNWWQDTDFYSLVGLEFTLTNLGDLPEYPHFAEITLGNEITTNGLCLPTVVLPKQSKQTYCSLYLPNISQGTYPLELWIKNSENETISMVTQMITVSSNENSWEYRWRYQGQQLLTIPKDELLSSYYQKLDRFLEEDYAVYVFDPYDDQYLHIVTDRLRSLMDVTEDGEIITFIASFVQNLIYRRDDENNASSEYPRYPLETLRENGGDCEDKAILAAALLNQLGYNVSLLRLPLHMAVGVHLNKTTSPLYQYYIAEYFYLETTNPPAILGRVPQEYIGLTNVTVYPISLRPLLFHHWKNATRYTTQDGPDYVKMILTVENLGSASATNIEIKSSFVSRYNLSYNQESVPIPSLAPGEKTEAFLKISVPQGVSTRLKTWVYLNGMIVNSKESSSLFT